MSIKLEKILTMSAGDYCKSVGKKLSDYKLQGIHASFNEREVGKTDPLVIFAEERVSNEIEAIVDYKFSIGGSGEINLSRLRLYTYHLDGTALIPKNKK